METVVIPVEGMHCSSCELLVVGALEDITGVFKAVADANAGQVILEIDNALSADQKSRLLEKCSEVIEHEGFMVKK